MPNWRIKLEKLTLWPAFWLQLDTAELLPPNPPKNKWLKGFEGKTRQTKQKDTWF